MPSHEERITTLEAVLKTPGQPADIAARLADAEKLLAEVAAVVGLEKKTKNGRHFHKGCFKAVADFLASIDNNPSTLSAIAAGAGLHREIAARVVLNHKGKFDKQDGVSRVKDSALYWLKDFKVKQEADAP